MVCVHHARVEALQDAAGFDCITSRAFSDLPLLVQSTRHLLAADGQWCAMKGSTQPMKLPRYRLTSQRASRPYRFQDWMRSAAWFGCKRKLLIAPRAAQRFMRTNCGGIAPPPAQYALAERGSALFHVKHPFSGIRQRRFFALQTKRWRRQNHHQRQPGRRAVAHWRASYWSLWTTRQCHHGVGREQARPERVGL